MGDAANTTSTKPNPAAQPQDERASVEVSRDAREHDQADDAPRVSSRVHAAETILTNTENVAREARQQHVTREREHFGGGHDDGEHDDVPVAPQQ